MGRPGNSWTLFFHEVCLLWYDGPLGEMPFTLNPLAKPQPSTSPAFNQRAMGGGRSATHTFAPLPCGHPLTARPAWLPSQATSAELAFGFCWAPGWPFRRCWPRSGGHRMRASRAALWKPRWGGFAQLHLTTSLHLRARPARREGVCALPHQSPGERERSATWEAP